MILNTSGVIRDSDLKFYFDPAIDGSKFNGNEWYDLSENGHVGVSADGSPEIVDEFGGVLRTDGTNDQLKLTESTTTNLNNITVSFFAKYESLTNGNGTGVQMVIYFGQLPTGSNVSIGRRNSKHIAWGPSGFIYVQTTDSVGPVADRWYCYTYTNDGSTHKLYIDGELRGTNTPTSNPSTTNTNILLSGWRTPTSNMGNWRENFKGDMGPLLLYDRVLTAEEVKQNFDAFRGRYGI